MKKILSVILCVALLLSFTACARDVSATAAAPAPDSSSPSTGASTDAKMVGKDLSKEPIKIAFLAAQMDANPVYWEQGIKKACSPYTNIEVTTFDAGGSAETQN